MLAQLRTDAHRNYRTRSMNTPTIILHDSSRDPGAELWFVEPPGFMALPLDVLLPEPGSGLADELRSVAAPFLESAPDEAARQKFIACFASAQPVLSALRDVGTVHCSIGLHSDDVDAANAQDIRPLFSLFTISWLETSVAPRGVTAARAVTSVAEQSHVEFLELACGPATLSESSFRAAAESDLPQRPLLQVRAFVPHPDCTRLAVLTLATPAIARREEYRAILRQIAESVCFENPIESGLLGTGA